MLETPFPSPDHDHAQCLEAAIARAKSVCKSKGIKFTQLREQVFRSIAASHKAVGAYDIIEIVAQNGKRIAPISMYRILDALSEIGLIHRLESQNSYFACHSGHNVDANDCRSQVFIICKTCNTVIEIEAPEIGTAVKKAAISSEFQLHQALLEIIGLCKHCSKSPKQA